MNILERIIIEKRKEVQQRKKQVSIPQLEERAFYKRRMFSLKESLMNRSGNGIIAEFKRRSPSKGLINDRDSVEKVTKAYAQFGASGISVLTDESFFGGSLDDLAAARFNELPILRKDFVVDEYQLTEAKAFGADLVLLIAACLSPSEVMQLATAAKQICLEVLLELHDETELGHICDHVDIIGVNNRNLKNFEVSLERSVELAERIGTEFVKIAESGIKTVEDVRFLKQHGFQGFLVGEHFMKQQDPALAFEEFSNQLKS